MDDLLSGTETTAAAINLQQQLNQATKEAGLPLRKWASNDSAVLEAIPVNQREILAPLNLDNAESISTLGLQWTPVTDVLSFTLPAPNSRVAVTKRAILSDTAKIFDPLGLLAPVIVRAKILLQEMWKVKATWDEELPSSLVNRWLSLREDLYGIEDIRVQRCTRQLQSKSVSLHGFSDASERAYAAAVYLRTIDEEGRISNRLIVAKTRIAPLKQVSLPRLELCAAVLLARLVILTQQSLPQMISEVHGWSDSRIVLAWLASHPQRWKTFVANRVSEIQNVRPAIQWHHVSGSSNPADCASRGINAKELANHPLWWHGPIWLCTEPIPTNEVHSKDDYPECSIEERAMPVVSMPCIQDSSLLERYSSLTKLLHVTAYIQRYLRNSRLASEVRELGPLTKLEKDNAFNHWIKATQLSQFGEEIQQLGRQKSISTRSKMLSLTPFLDSMGILRVGGRIRHAAISIDQIHPIILPRRSKLTDLIISAEHARTLHGGPQLMMASLQSRFWIIGLRDAVRFHVRRCMRCVRQRAKTVTQLMGNLPASRLNPGRAFIKCGVDYAGPICLKVMKGRGARSFKGYIAIFVCFITRALHLELVSDLTTAAFLAALKRFVSRRGRCTDIFSDCGTNFIGANKELKEFVRIVSTNLTDRNITQWLTDNGINWHFNPPAAPHFGGLWEAGVRSVKYHLKRVIGETQLTFEEMTTLLCQVEACLNSRPLTPMTSDPSDLAVLTPGHFLIGGPLMAIPEPDVTAIKINRLSRWQLGQQILQHFWRRWQAEFLSRLQQRPKWAGATRNLQVGDLVLLKEDLPPTKWRMARITAVHPGTDNLVRVVTVRTANGELKRPITKLCQLPLDSNS